MSAGTDLTAGSSAVDELAELQRLLLDAEQRAASVPELELRIVTLEHAVAQARQEALDARAQALELDERLMRAEQVRIQLMNSPSWRVTKPLRRAKTLLR